MTPGLILESVGEDTTAYNDVYGQSVRVSTILGLVGLSPGGNLL